MWNAEVELLIFSVFAVTIGVIVFGGTTLAYFLDKRHRDPRPKTRRAPAQRGGLPRSTKVVGTR